MLLREYHGERHTVIVVANGYVWREVTYASLSTIARAITGTAWNGPRFFGLRSGREFAIATAVADASSGLPAAQLAGKAGIKPRQAVASRRRGDKSAAVMSPLHGGEHRS